MRSFIAAFVTLAACIQSALAIALLDTADPLANTADVPPVCGSWQDGAGVPVAPNWFVTVEHLGGAPGQIFLFNGVEYTTTETVLDPQGIGVRLWRVDKPFPAFVPLLDTTDAIGDKLLLVGRGDIRSTNEVRVTCTATNYTTNVVRALPPRGQRTNGQAIPPGKSKKRHVITTNTVQVERIAGWRYAPGGGLMRHGANTVDSVSPCCLGLGFGNVPIRHECLAGLNDSGGFAGRRSGNVYLLSGLITGVGGTHLAATQGGPDLTAAYIDFSGMWSPFQAAMQFPCAGGPRHSSTYVVRLGPIRAWITAITAPSNSNIGSPLTPSTNLIMTADNTRITNTWINYDNSNLILFRIDEGPTATNIIFLPQAALVPPNPN